MTESHKEKRGGSEEVESWAPWGCGWLRRLKQRQLSTLSSFSSSVCKSSIPGGKTSRAGRRLDCLRSMGFAPLRNWYPKRASSFQESRTRPEGIS